MADAAASDTAAAAFFALVTNPATRLAVRHLRRPSAEACHAA